MSTAVWQDALNAVQSEIAEIEKILSEEIRSRVTVVSQVNRHTLDAGGKRLRPAFTMLVARATSREFDEHRARRLAACQEMIHMATLIHDDVIDHADQRRGRPAAATIFGNTAAILSGDVLLAKAMQILAADGDLEIIRMVSQSVVAMAEGEAREVETHNQFDLTRADHEEILYMKTASFVECCCKVGAKVAGAEDSVVENYGIFGREIGLAFQIIDDVLDFSGDFENTGKPIATDFREGCMTLPMILLRNRLTEEELEFAQNRFGAQPTVDELAMISAWMDSRGAFEEARSIALDRANQARLALRKTPEGPHRDILEKVIDYVLDRDR